MPLHRNGHIASVSILGCLPGAKLEPALCLFCSCHPRSVVCLSPETNDEGPRAHFSNGEITSSSNNNNNNNPKTNKIRTTMEGITLIGQHVHHDDPDFPVVAPDVWKNSDDEYVDLGLDPEERRAYYHAAN